MPNIDQWLWMPHNELLFIPVRITPNTDGKYTILEDTDGNTYKYSTTKLNKLSVAAVSNFSGLMPDLTSLQDLSEASILYALRQNYLSDNIYVNIGTILVSINPFCMLPLYGEEMMNKYCNNKTFLSEAPHIYQATMSCYETVRRDQQNASLIISGESGSGKTVITRSVLDFLCHITNNSNSNSTSGIDIKQLISGTNPILEAFGNAKTLRNNNSSRVGKWIDILLCDNTICGCNIIDYLLEKIRVVHVEKEERNYHIFYQLFKNNIIDKKKFLLDKDLKSFLFLNQNNCSFEAENIDDSQEFDNCYNAMKTLKWDQTEIDGIFYILSGILHLGNVHFSIGGIENKNDEAFIEEGVNNEFIQNVGKLFQISDINLIIKALTTKPMTTGKTTMIIPIAKDQAIKAINSLCMAIYDKLFKWIVKNVNKSLRESLDFNESTYESEEINSFHIGILDIFGFECFEKNLFEQFLINHANEKLQYQFNQNIFESEQIEYKKEGINMQEIAFENNLECIEMVEMKGLIDMLSEEVSLNGSDKTFKQKLDNRFKDNAYYRPYLKQDSVFTISHYAGNVNYDSTGFLEKTKNVLMPHLIDLVNTSDHPILNTLFKSSSKNNNKNKSKTLGKHFISDLSKLIKAVNATKPTYVRCIKPNDEKQKHIWNASKVLNQMKCGGLFSAISVRQKGFSYRQHFGYFVERYKWCVKDKGIRNKFDGDTDFKKICEIIINHIRDKLNANDIQIGETKIFYRESQLVILENIRDENLKLIFVSTQKLIRYANVLRQLAILKKIKKILNDGFAENNKTKIQKGIEIFYAYNKKEVNLFRMDEIDKAEEFMKNAGDEFDEVDQVDDGCKQMDIVDANDLSVDLTPERNSNNSTSSDSKYIEAFVEDVDDDFSSLCVPSIKQFDSMSIVSTIDDEIIRELERSDSDLNVLIAEESKVFGRLRDVVVGSWTQRFVSKRMKIKFVNILFKRRISLLHEFSRNDQLNTNKLLIAYNGLSEYTFYHENKLKKMIKITGNVEMFTYYIQNMAAKFIQNAIDFDLKNKNKHSLFLHSLSHIFGLDIDDNDGNERLMYPDNNTIIELQEMIKKIRIKLYDDFDKINNSIQLSQNNINTQIEKMQEIFFNNCGNINTRNPLIKDNIFNFISVSKIMKQNYKKLMIPKIYLNKMIIHYIPLFQKLTKYAENVLIQNNIKWCKYNYRSFQFTQNIWNELQLKYKNNNCNNDEEDDILNDPEWLKDNFHETNTFLRNEITALEKLLSDQIVSECFVNILQSSMSITDNIIMKAILCESGSIYFYQHNDNDDQDKLTQNEFKFVIDLSTITNIHHHDNDNVLQFVFNKGNKIALQFQNYNVYQKWKSIHLSSLIPQ